MNTHGIVPDDFVRGLVAAGAAGAALLGATWVGVNLLKRASASLRHAFWFAGLAGALLVPLLTGIVPAWDVLPRTESTRWISAPVGLPAIPTGDKGGDQAAAPTVSSAPTVRSARASEPLSTGALIGTVWVVGAVLALVPLAAGRWMLHRLVRRCRRVTDAGMLALLERCTAELSLRRKPELLECDGPVMPMTWGILRPRLVLPAEYSDWSERRRRMVLLHELGHVARHDCLTQSIAQIARALYWFNPLAWVAASRMQAEQEIACDDLAMGRDGLCYAEELLAVSSSLRPAAGSVAGVAMAHRSRLGERVRAALDDRRDRRPVGIAGVIAAGILALVGVLPLACASAGALSRSTAQPADRKITGARPADDATALFARRLVQIGAAINQYIPDNNGHLPPDLGQILQFTRPPGAAPDAPVSGAARASAFLSPADEKSLAIPAEPTPDWVNEHASIVYIGRALSPHGSAVVPDWSKAVIAHTKLDGADRSVPALILYLDGHVQVVPSRDEAVKIVAASRQAAAAALPEYLRCSSRIRGVGQAIAIYTYDDKNKMRLPPDLGATFPYMRPTHFLGDMVPPDTQAERARQYLCPIDERNTVIPAEPTGQWVNKHTSYVYLGTAEVNPEHVADWGKTVIAHDRLDHEHSNAPVPPGKKESRGIVLLFLDSHTEVTTKADAERIIAESKKTLDAARGK